MFHVPIIYRPFVCAFHWSKFPASMLYRSLFCGLGVYGSFFHASIIHRSFFFGLIVYWSFFTYRLSIDPSSGYGSSTVQSSMYRLFVDRSFIAWSSIDQDSGYQFSITIVLLWAGLQIRSFFDRSSMDWLSAAGVIFLSALIRVSYSWIRFFASPDWLETRRANPYRSSDLDSLLSLHV